MLYMRGIEQQQYVPLLRARVHGRAAAALHHRATHCLCPSSRCSLAPAP
jgi:hypothetical protein